MVYYTFHLYLNPFTAQNDFPIPECLITKNILVSQLLRKTHKSSLIKIFIKFLLLISNPYSIYFTQFLLLLISTVKVKFLNLCIARWDFFAFLLGFTARKKVQLKHKHQETMVENSPVLVKCTVRLAGRLASPGLAQPAILQCLRLKIYSLRAQLKNDITAMLSFNQDNTCLNYLN